MINKLLNYCKQENIWIYKDNRFKGARFFYDKQGYQISFVTSDNEEKDLFTLAHECGHYIAHNRRLKQYNDPYYQYYNEKLAWKLTYVLLRSLDISFNPAKYKEFKNECLESYKVK